MVKKMLRCNTAYSKESPTHIFCPPSSYPLSFSYFPDHPCLFPMYPSIHCFHIFMNIKANTKGYALPLPPTLKKNSNLYFRELTQ